MRTSKYQPQWMDPSITLPFVADKVRSKGIGFYPTVVKTNKNDIQVGNEELFNLRKREADMMANAKVQSTLSSHRNLLRPRHPRLEPYNRSGQPFFLNPDQTQKQLSSVSGGATITYSSRMSEKDREERRRKILERLGTDYEKFRQGDTSETVREIKPLQGEEARKNDAKLLLEFLIDAINTGDFKASFLSDFLRVQNFIVNDIANWNDYTTFDNYLDKLDVLLEALQGDMADKIATKLSDTRENYMINYLNFLETNAPSRVDIYKLQSAKEDYESILDNYKAAHTKGIETLFNSVRRLANYIKANAAGIGQPEQLRRKLAKSSFNELKQDYKEISKVSEKMYKDLYEQEQAIFQELGVQLPEKIVDEDRPEPLPPLEQPPTMSQAARDFMAEADALISQTDQQLQSNVGVGPDNLPSNVGVGPTDLNIGPATGQGRKIRKTKKSDIVIPKGKFIKEHKNLIHLLDMVNNEKKDQAKELKKVLKGGLFGLNRKSIGEMLKEVKGKGKK